MKVHIAALAVICSYVAFAQEPAVLRDPGTNGIIKRTAKGQTAPAAPNDVTTLLGNPNATVDTTNAANINSGTLSPARLPSPTAGTIGGVESFAVVNHQFLTGISTGGVPSAAQPACADLSNSSPSCSTDTTNAANIVSGILSGNLFPAFTGDVRKPSGSLVTTVLAINGTTVPINSNAVNDTVLIAEPTATGAWITVPGCLDSGGNHLNYNTTTHVLFCGSSGGGSGSSAFNTLTGGTNNQAAMIVGSGATLAPTSLVAGVITANSVTSGAGLATTTGGQLGFDSTGTLYHVFSGGADAVLATSNAASLTSGTLAAARLPNPSASTLGGVQSIAPVSHQWINTISTSGVPASTQPAFTDITGTATAAQLPNPSASTLGGIESLVPTSHQWINTISTSGVPASTQPAFTDISGVAAAAQLPNPSASTLGGIESLVGTSHQWINTISTSGVPSSTQPAFTDISGSVAAGQMPALTGDTTMTAGTTATTVAKVNGTSVTTSSAADQAIVTTALATAAWTALPGCLDSGGNHLNYNTSTHAFSCGTSGGSAGSAAFNSITSGSNTQAAMVVGTGGSIAVAGTGTVTATQVPSAAGATTTTGGQIAFDSTGTLYHVFSGGADSVVATSNAASLTSGTLTAARLPATAVQTNQANTYTSGLQDLSATTLKVPVASGATPTTAGLVQYDSSTNNLFFGNGTQTNKATWFTGAAPTGISKWGAAGQLSAAVSGTDYYAPGIAINIADIPAGVAKTTTANTFTAGDKQTFQADATSAAINVAGVSSDPGSVSDGDLWYRSDTGRLQLKVGSTTNQIPLLAQSVQNNAVNTGSTGMTLDMTAATGSNALKVPAAASATTSANAAIAYDSTTQLYHGFFGGADAAFASVNAASLTAGTIAAGRLPAFTGDTTSTIGTGATVTSSLNGGVSAIHGYPIPIAACNGATDVSAIINTYLLSGKATVYRIPDQPNVGNPSLACLLGTKLAIPDNTTLIFGNGYYTCSMTTDPGSSSGCIVLGSTVGGSNLIGQGIGTTTIALNTGGHNITDVVWLGNNISGTNNHLISNITLNGNEATNETAAGGLFTCIAGRNNDNVYITYSELTGCGERGVDFRGGSNYVFDHNLIHTTGENLNGHTRGADGGFCGNGLSVDLASNGSNMPYNVSITNNIIWDQGDSITTKAWWTRVTDNVVYGSSAVGLTPCSKENGFDSFGSTFSSYIGNKMIGLKIAAIALAPAFTNSLEPNGAVQNGVVTPQITTGQTPYTYILDQWTGLNGTGSITGAGGIASTTSGVPLSTMTATTFNLVTWPQSTASWPWGTISCTSGSTTCAWVSGVNFQTGASWCGKSIFVNGVQYTTAASSCVSAVTGNVVLSSSFAQTTGTYFYTFGFGSVTLRRFNTCLLTAALSGNGIAGIKACPTNGFGNVGTVNGPSGNQTASCTSGTNPAIGNAQSADCGQNGDNAIGTNWILPPQDVKIADNYFEGGSTSSAVSIGNAGFSIPLRDIDIHDNSFNAIQLQNVGVYNLKIHDNTFKDDIGTGSNAGGYISISDNGASGTTTGMMKHWTITNNDFTCTQVHQDPVSVSGNVLSIDDSKFSGNQTYGNGINGSPNTIGCNKNIIPQAGAVIVPTITSPIAGATGSNSNSTFTINTAYQGQVQLVTTGTGITNGQFLQIAFAGQAPDIAYCTLAPLNSAAAASTIQPYQSALTKTGATPNVQFSGFIPASSATYQWMYRCYPMN